MSDEESTPVHLIAIDPGDLFCGVAFFTRGSDGVWECVDAQELAPADLELALLETVMDPEEPLEWIVYERFRLYGDKANEQKGSEFPTSQLIGVIKFIHRIHDIHMDLHDRADVPGSGAILSCELTGERHSIHPPHRIQIAGQMADIKKPVTGILRKKKIKSTAKPISRELYKGRDHVVDAELHGFYHIMKTLDEEARG